MVGEAVGLADGWLDTVGTCEGLALGSIDGDRVGDTEGDAVG